MNITGNAMAMGIKNTNSLGPDVILCVFVPKIIFRTHEPKAHSAHRSAYRILMVRRPRLRPQCLNIFFSNAAWPIKAKFYVEPPWAGETKVCSRHLSHMTKIAATPIYGKIPLKSSTPEPAGQCLRNLVCSIGDSSPSWSVQMMTLE